MEAQLQNTVLRLSRSHASLSALAEIANTVGPQRGMSLITLRARVDKGTVRGNPFFVFLRTTVRASRSTSSHRIASSSLRRIPVSTAQLDNGRKPAAA